MKFKNKEDLKSHYDNLWKTREGNVCEWMQITWYECRMYQRDKCSFLDFMLEKHSLFGDYNEHVVTKRNEYRSLKNGDRIKYIGQKCDCFTKNKIYDVARDKKSISPKDVWLTSDTGKYGYIVEDDYIYNFELIGMSTINDN